MESRKKNKDRNSIYEYYDRTPSNRFYIPITFYSNGMRQVKYIWDPLASDVKIKGFEDYDFFITGRNKKFQLREGITGTIILEQKEIQARFVRRGGYKTLIDHLPAELNERGGRSSLNQKIINTICDYHHQISPRYKHQVEVKAKQMP